MGSFCRLHNTIFVFILSTSFYRSFTFADLDPAAFRFDTFDTPKRKCEPIIVDMCKDHLGYNFTGVPNLLNGETYTQQGSRDLLLTFKPLISHRCSSQLKMFLCTAYVPMCDTQVEQLIGPCRSVCENVKNRCEPYLKTYGHPWPAALNCSVFPASNTEESMCMEFPQEEDSDQDGGFDQTTRSQKRLTETVTLAPNQQCFWLRKPSAYVYVNTTGTCHPRCNVDILFTKGQKQYAEIWIAVWTSFCLLLSILTVATFLIDTSKFHYPIRPIIFLSLCYAMYSVGYLIRLIAGRESVTCDSDGTMTQGLDNTNCAAVFLLLYYFNSATALWWVILSVTWLLTAGFKWSHDAIDLYTSYFHLVAWGIPAVKSIIIIVLRNVYSEELTGLCYVGSSNSSSILGFVIAPFTVYLLLGVTLLVAGYVVLFLHQKKNSGKSDERIEVLMVRVGIFGLLYTVAMTCHIACNFYEYANYPYWYTSSHATASVEIYSLKIASALLPGITSALCVLSCNSLDTWTSISCMCSKDSTRNKTYQLSKNSNNNNSSRHYTPVMTHPNKQLTMSHSCGRTSSTSRTSKVRSQSHSHRYFHSPNSSQSLQHPEEYHV